MTPTPRYPALMLTPAEDEALRQEMLVADARSDRDLFLCGLYTDSVGRMFAADLERRGYSAVVALRIAGRGFGVLP